ncbi:MAG: PAS domain S-box protein [Candidatus Latescibacteria bacterium]|nr:PAS domain S-box protein [Candidatus Latescibacterota bacterium]NIM21201.1 PAS domain S-box protein [Candidatus Latescibacterota bacterium]NIM65455.1 PAS domain S-box protein [Candidatus Latescibacterota bacterium]NIO01833.1 PAS domain S-box protein [Candidatus Latescibacterota bacterium]NIO28483.1 PAS domain S-box protein [Candidatus Latescibacterota bacterium]
MAKKKTRETASRSTSARPGQQLIAMVRISNTILQCTELDDILASITRELSSLIEFDRSDIALYVPEKNALVLRHIHKGDKRSTKYGENREIPMDETNVIGWAAVHKKLIVRTDIKEDKRFVEIVSEEKLQSDVIVPLIAREKLIGTLNVGSRRKNFFSGTDLEIIENCAKLACVAVEHALLLKEAKELGEKYKALQKSANDLIILINPNTGKLMEINNKAESALGLKRENVESKSFFDLFAEEDQYQARRDFINVLSQKSTSFVDRRMITSDGGVIYVDINASLVQLEGGVSIQTIIHDVSQRKMLEQQIIRQNKNLQDINKKLKELDEMKTEFLARITHELKTPLSIILAYSESLRHADLPAEEQEKFLDVIDEQGQSLLSLIDNLLDLSNLEISTTMLNVTLGHLHDVIRSIWPQVERSARAKDISISFQPGYDIPVTYLDNKRILQVLSCLVNNAIKFTDSGRSIEVRTKVDDGEIWVEVADTGEGIPAEKIPGIFDTFHQIDGSISRRWGGMGIGLAMAKHIIDLHGGKIWVESEVGMGSIFTFSLPVEVGSDFLPELYRGEQAIPVEEELFESRDSDVSAGSDAEKSPASPDNTIEEALIPDTGSQESS